MRCLDASQHLWVPSIILVWGTSIFLLMQAPVVIRMTSFLRIRPRGFGDDECGFAETIKLES